jgi:hypothetical protein
MSDMSPEGEALVRAARRAFGPSGADRVRVLEALQSRLGDAALLARATPATAAQVGGSRALRLLLSRWGVVGLAALGTAGVFLGAGLARAPRHDAAPAPLTALESVAPAGTGAASPGEAQPAKAEEPPAAFALPNAPHPPETRSAPRRQTRDGLSDEVALLSRAEVELNGGHPESALRELDEHERRFPHGLLTEERTAARVQALCALGRFAEGNAELAQLARVSPHSPLAERARQACRDPSRP